MLTKEKIKRRIRCHKRVRAKIFGTAVRPRLSVFRSNKYLRVQLVDDETGRTLLQMTDLKKNSKAKKSKIDSARDLGKSFAAEAKKKKINAAVFDKGGYLYHGRVKALADAVREGGIKF